MLPYYLALATVRCLATLLLIDSLHASFPGCDATEGMPQQVGHLVLPGTEADVHTSCVR